MAEGANTTLGGFSGHRNSYYREFSRPVVRRKVLSARPPVISDISSRQFAEEHKEKHATIPKLAEVQTQQTQTKTVFPPQKTQEYLQKPTDTYVAHRKKHHNYSKIIQSKFVNVAKNKLRTSLIALGVVFIISGAYIGYYGWHENHIAQLQASRLTQQANKAALSTKSSSSSSSTPSTVKPSPSALASYVVAPNLPRYLIIPKLNVDARILSVGVNAKGALETPDNVFDTAWYNESASPGQPGATLIDGHVSSWTAHGVFYGIKTLQAGDTIKIVRGDGAVFVYSVVKTQIYPSGNVDMSAAMTPVTAGKSGLNLITCTGDVIPGTNLFNERVIVFAQLVSQTPPNV